MQEFGEGEIPNENYSATNFTHFKHMCNILLTEKAGDVNV